ncbi:MAG: hypothetical protein AB7W16_21605 [Candidatus Obscuribacterales bacterium]
MITSRDLSAIPDPLQLRRRLLALAVLDSLLNRFSCEFGFFPEWSPGVEVAIQDNECGDILNVFFCDNGTLIKGFAHESYMSPYGDAPFAPEEVDGVQCFPGLLDGVPEALLPFCVGSDGGIESPTTVIWRLPDRPWQRGDFRWPEGDDVPEDPDLSGDLLSWLDMSVDDYTVWAREYYGAEHLDPRDVEAIFAGSALTGELAASIQPEWQSSNILARLSQTGYPLESASNFQGALKRSLTPVDIDEADAAVFEAIFHPQGDPVRISINHADGIKIGPIKASINEAKRQAGAQISSEISSSVQGVAYEWKYMTEDADSLGQCLRNALSELQLPAGGFIEYLGQRFEL